MTVKKQKKQAKHLEARNSGKKSEKNQIGH